MRDRIAALLTCATICGQAAASAQTAPVAPASPASGTAMAGAGRQDDFVIAQFTVSNESGHAITTLNVSPAGTGTWSPNILGHDRLADGEFTDVGFARREHQCAWDIKADYDGGHIDMPNVNLCEVGSVALTAG
jgi:hypothetical protein